MTLHHTPSDQEIDSAKTVMRLLEDATTKTPLETAALSQELTHFLHEILKRISYGESLTVFSQNEELTTTQAAKLLKMSRPYLIHLLENGEIPFRKIGKHRRILLKDLLRYQKDTLMPKRALSSEITHMAQEMDLEY